MQSPQATAKPQATDQPTTTSLEIAPTPVAPNDNEAAVASAIDMEISTVNDWITAMSVEDNETAHRLMTDRAKSIYSPDFLISFRG